MYRLIDILGDYEDPDPIDVPGISGGLPIRSPEGLDWKTLTDPTRLSKMFMFQDESKFNAFVMDVLEHQSETQHHGRMTIQYPQVKIEVWTHTLNDITEIDMEWAKVVSEIYEGYHE